MELCSILGRMAAETGGMGMRRPENYNTKQQSAILDYIANHSKSPVTAAQLIADFEKEGVLVGRTTVYRHLGKLVENGKVCKYVIDGVAGACYQYAGNAEDCETLLHLKCEGCGRLFDLDCGLFDEVRQHFVKHHVFQINVTKTVMYGTCEHCSQNRLNIDSY
jgi:Fur family ferric uptake transcriptional regulator